MKRRMKKTSRFWLIYAITATVLLFAVFAGLVLFYDFIDAFEKSQPQSPAEAAKLYAATLTEDDIRALVNNEAEKLTWSNKEALSRTVDTYVDAWKAGGMFCRRSGGSEASPVYTVVSGHRDICSILLKKAPIGRYSFDAWSVAETYVNFDGFDRYTVTVPLGTALTVNGALLDESYITEKDISYSQSPIEAGANGIPTAVTYETELLDAVPALKAVYRDTELQFDISGNAFTAKYPETLLTSAVVKVPSGAVVTVRGVNLANSCEKTSESAFGGLIAEGLTVPSFDIYTLEGLYAPLDNVSITLNGSPLKYTEASEGTSQTVFADIGSVTDASVGTFADEFTRAYFNYTSSGYKNIDENLAAALSYVLTGSEIYTRIRDSKVGYDFVTPVTSQVYNRLETVRMYRLEDGSYIVMLAFDVDHQIYSESRSYKGEISLHIVNIGEYKVANMVIDNK